MTDFGKIMRRGKRRFNIKQNAPISKWDRCEACDVRIEVFPYNDEKGEVWLLCAECTNLFVKDEEK